MAAQTNTRGINHLRKAVRAPEDFFNIGTTLRVAYASGNEDSGELETMFVKLREYEWLYLDGSNGDTGVVDFEYVVGAVTSASRASDLTVQIAHVWKSVDL